MGTKWGKPRHEDQTQAHNRDTERGTEDKDTRDPNKKVTKLIISKLRGVIRINSELTS